MAEANRVEAKNDRFWNCVDRGAKVEGMVKDFESIGGLVTSRLGYVLVSDTARGRVMRWEGNKLSEYRSGLDAPRGITFDHQGRLLAALRHQVIRVEKNGAVAVMADSLNTPGDVVYAIDGSIYFADSSAKRVQQVTRDRGGVGGLPNRGMVRPVAIDCTTPQGVALSPNQQQLYVSDPGAKVIRVYPIAADGKLGSGREFVRLVGGAVKTDEAGNVWVATPEGVTVLDAQGQTLGLIATSESPVALNWGQGFRGLLIASKTGVSRISTKSNGTRTY